MYLLRSGAGGAAAAGGAGGRGVRRNATCPWQPPTPHCCRAVSRGRPSAAAGAGISRRVPHAAQVPASRSHGPFLMDGR